MITKSIGKLSKLKVKGDDGENVQYQSIDHMWATELNPDFAKVEEELKGQKEPRIGTKQDWYSGSVKYWNEQPATVDGVLGGYGVVHQVDSDTSAKMIADFSDRISGFRTAVDMGAGIGRIAKTTLVPRFTEVDLVEPAEV